MRFQLVNGMIVEAEEVQENRLVNVYGFLQIEAKKGDWIVKMEDATPVWPKNFFEAVAKPLFLN